MANAFYDFDFANFGLGQSIFQPYVGVGAGYVWTDMDNVRGNGGAGQRATIYSDDAAGRFAYQGIAGVATPLTWLGVTGLSLTAEYRFMGTLEPRLDASVRNTATGPTVRGKIEPEQHATTRSCSACATPCSSRRRPPPPMAEAPPPAPRRPRPAPTWSSSTGIVRT